MSSASAVKMSSAMMKEANEVMNIEEMAKTMEEMQMEMAKAQLADEVMEEALEDPEDDAEIDTELQKVYEEVALDASMMMGVGPGSRGPASAPAQHADPMRTRLPQDIVPGGDPLDTR